jgi:two-component system response regulator AtoC
MNLCLENALVVDDDVLMREFIVETLRRNQIEVTQAGNGLEAKRILDEREFDIAFVDLKMPGMDGMQLLRHVRESNSGMMTVMVTAFGTVEQAVEAMKIGASDFLMKPFSPEQVELILKRAREWIAMRMQNAYLQEELGWRLPGGRRILGQSRAVKGIMQSIEQVAKTPATVLITGESGTGKELVALAIHTLSGRRDSPFVRMNCAAVPDTLMDSELFGHEKGAFTSAVNRRLGRFELASGGSILLDEIGEMKIGLQAKLLRVLQEQEFERVGGNRTIRVDCRVMATTNRDLTKEILNGTFRQDLYYRLNVVPIHMASLRERPEDIPLLARTFLEKFAPLRGTQREPLRFSDAAIERLSRYAWPGNVRELENLVERFSVMEEGPVIGPESLPEAIRGGTPPSPAASMDTSMPTSTVTAAHQADVPPPPETRDHREVHAEPPTLNLAELERRTIMAALAENDNNRLQTAKTLGISVRTLRNKLNLYREQGALQMAG